VTSYAAPLLLGKPPLSGSAYRRAKAALRPVRNAICAFGGRAYDRQNRLCQGGLLRMMNFAYAAFMAETQDEKKARLAQALRDNLRRRKAQSRDAVREEGDASPPPDPSRR